ncbi:hypothetical protein SAMN05444354_116124 [Stigmatella aurantiaca]|uniref:Lipoprotein n=1 Tax=Stigmatella aurantiaca TaxID=41 RepID=A0A1H7Y730_STIAU|nr:hypothetical protein [Stigmatella aurantiaca]SEM41940.1 hypothetical protein SAMN05444354_116124 [Stigmatella aurantiaca]
MRPGSLLFAAVMLLTLSACGEMPEPEGGDSQELNQSTAALSSCTNDCSSTGGSPVSCSGFFCSSGNNPGGSYVVCDGQFTYCQPPPPPPPPGPCAGFQINCPYGGSVQCPSSTQTCSEYSTCSILCDGVELRCWTQPGLACAIY